MRHSLEDRIEHELGLEARMAAEMLAHHAAATEVQLDAEMPALGDKIPAEDIRAIAQWLGKRK